ncbi:hypothetical protein F4703DRAFT_1828983 [Phycomyces blakesleeanus]
MKPPIHPGNPVWKTRSEWLKMKESTAVDIIITKEQSRDDLLKKFRLKDEITNQGWGDESVEAESGWGEPKASSGW